jgi:hypothetical protein
MVSPAASTALITIVIAQFVTIALSLVPFRSTVDGVPADSDGRQLFQLFVGRDDWTTPRKAYVARLRRYSSTGETGPIEPRRSERIYYQMSHPAGWATEQNRREVQDALMRELGHGGLGREEEMLVLDLLLTYGLVCDDPDLRSRLDDWSLRALELGPEIRTLLATRGGVLISLGRYAEGIALLSSLPSAQENAPFDALFDAFMNQIFLRVHSTLSAIAPSRTPWSLQHELPPKPWARIP